MKCKKNLYIYSFYLELTDNRWDNNKKIGKFHKILNAKIISKGQLNKEILTFERNDYYKKSKKLYNVSKYKFFFLEIR